MSGWFDVWYRLNFCWVWATYTLGFSYRSRGSHFMPRSGPVLILANHESFLDPLAVGLAVRRSIHYLAKKPLFQPPLFGRYLRSVGCVPVDQDGVAKEGMRTSVELLHAGKPLVIFPEGERSFDGKMQPFKPGISLILKRAPVPIVPVGIAGAFEAYPRQAKVPRLAPLFWPCHGSGLACSVGKPIQPEKYKTMDREQLLLFLFDAVAEQVDLAERLKRKG